MWKRVGRDRSRTRYTPGEQRRRTVVAVGKSSTPEHACSGQKFSRRVNLDKSPGEVFSTLPLGAARSILVNGTPTPVPVAQLRLPSMPASSPTIRLATTSDVPALQSLIAQSVRGLSVGIYSPEQIEVSLNDVFGVDTQLIDDGTYFVIDGESEPAAAGGWSARRTLFGGNQMKRSEDPRLDPATEPARIRAFFVHPAYARQGLARNLYNRCARDAYAMGFRHFELMATMPGVPLYEALGFAPLEAISFPMHGDVVLPLVHMRRAIEDSRMTA